VFATWSPEFAAVEQSFVNRDGAASLKLGHARAISLLVPARLGLRVEEYAPNFIKRAVTGAGHAGKSQIGAMVSMLLPTAELHDEHATDALAVAITLAHAGDFSGRLQAALRKADTAEAVQ
jgi:crossover junction endodeoxyribonuclease RuvC